MVVTEKEIEELKVEAKGLSTTSYNIVHIKKGKNIIVEYSIIQILACCGTAHLADVKRHKPTDNKDKEFIFKEIVDWCNRNALRNIIYLDTEDGLINDILGNKFKLIDEYRNPNTDNIVEVRSYTIPTYQVTYVDNDLPEDYDSRGFDVQEWEDSWEDNDD